RTHPAQSADDVELQARAVFKAIEKVAHEKIPNPDSADLIWHKSNGIDIVGGKKDFFMGVEGFTRNKLALSTTSISAGPLGMTTEIRAVKLKTSKKDKSKSPEQCDLLPGTPTLHQDVHTKDMTVYSDTGAMQLIRFFDIPTG